MRILTVAISLASLTFPGSAFEVLHDRSTLGFEVGMGDRQLAGEFSDWRAEVDLEEGDIRVTVGLASATLGDPLLDAVMHAPAWLASGDHGQAVFASHDVEAKAPGRHRADGTLSFKGATIPMTVLIDAATPPPGTRYAVTATLDRIEAGAGPDGSPVDRTVTIIGQIEVRR
ncbi:YceI family protein [Jannaschia sp. KMU-145]|uniref:YceI family protein n=1 Tax=Jannaschia halovivens TaxID=3388667 RepID=UPI00396B1B84